MKYYTCDVCGRVLNNETPLTLRHESAIFGFDLCVDCKMKERAIDMKALWLEKMREDT